MFIQVSHPLVEYTPGSQVGRRGDVRFPAPVSYPGDVKISKSSRAWKCFQFCQESLLLLCLSCWSSNHYRFPLLITHLGASFEILCVILDNSQNGESKVGQMLRRGMLVGFCSMRLKDFCLIKHNKMSVERGCDHL